MRKAVFRLLIASLVLSIGAEPVHSGASAGDPRRGQDVFESLTCIDCHKGGGNSVKPSKPLKGQSFAKKYSRDEKIEKVIRNGVAGASMPSFGKDVIDDDQMKDLIAYIRSLTQDLPKSSGEAKKSLKGSKANSD